MLRNLSRNVPCWASTSEMPTAKVWSNWEGPCPGNTCTVGKNSAGAGRQAGVAKGAGAVSMTARHDRIPDCRKPWRWRSFGRQQPAYFHFKPAVQLSQSPPPGLPRSWRWGLRTEQSAH